MVIADTNIWISYLRDPDSETGLALQALIDQNQILMAGVVFAEILQGARTQRDYDSLLTALTAFPYEEMNDTTWALAGRVGFHLNRSGSLIPLTDLAIAALALQGGHAVFSMDSHFDRVTALKRYSIAAGQAD